MAEEWGNVIFKVDGETLQRFKKSTQSSTFDLALELVKAAEVETSELKSDNYQVDEFEFDEEYGFFDFNGSDWREVAEAIVAKGHGIELYSRIYDEYGTAYFYLLNADGEISQYSYEKNDQLYEIDEYEVESYDSEVMQSIDQWISMVPDNVKSKFPNIIDVESLELDEI